MGIVNHQFGHIALSGYEFNIVRTLRIFYDKKAATFIIDGCFRHKTGDLGINS